MTTFRDPASGTKLTRAQAEARLLHTTHKHTLSDEDLAARTGLQIIVPFVPEAGMVIVPGTESFAGEGLYTQQSFAVETIANKEAREEAEQEAQQAAQEAAHQAYLSAIRPVALMFATTLRLYFPDLDPPAEQNHGVTQEAVEAHFVAMRYSGTITVEALADGVLLDKMFTALRQPDGTTWSLPWDEIWAGAQ